MKITTFNPQIVTKDPAAVIALFEALGFQRTHNKVGNDDFVFSANRMKMPKEGEGAKSFYVDVVEAEGMPLEKDFTAIRMNVDDFDEAYQTLIDNGFRESKIAGTHFTSSSKFAYMVSPTGFVIDLVKHIKNHD